MVWGTVEYLIPRQGGKMYEIECIWVYDTLDGGKRA